MLRYLAADLRALLWAAAAALIIRLFVFSLIRVKGRSMLGTLHDGDRLYVSILSAHLGGFHRGDVVICRFPGRKGLFVKRLIALPGDTVEVREGVVVVNGVVLVEDYIYHRSLYTRPPLTLKPGTYYVLGDNRRSSHDSHDADVGPVTRLVGKVRAIIWPIKRIRRIR